MQVVGEREMHREKGNEIDCRRERERERCIDRKGMISIVGEREMYKERENEIYVAYCSFER